eukprot:364208-Chlamydomonas_euryale.AAC.20
MTAPTKTQVRARATSSPASACLCPKGAHHDRVHEAAAALDGTRVAHRRALDSVPRQLPGHVQHAAQIPAARGARRADSASRYPQARAGAPK